MSIWRAIAHVLVSMFPLYVALFLGYGSMRAVAHVLVSHVLVSMLPLYVALFLGYGSMVWWNLFSHEQSEGIHTFVCYITLPLYTLEFIANSNPYHWNFRFLAADILSKLVIIIALTIWTKYSNKGNYPWAITSFSLSTLTNAFVVGVPLVQSMYGSNAVDIVVQSSTIQAIIWLTIFLFILELRRTTTKESTENEVCCTGSKTKQNTEYDISDTVLVLIEDGEESFKLKEDVQESLEITGDVEKNTNAKPHKTSFLVSLRTVFLKLRRNPNAYCSVVGLIWALIANRFHWKMPSIMEGSILILSRAGTGAAMFSMGLFMAMQEKLIACGTKLTVVGIVLRFLAGPAAMAICCLAVGLRGDVL